MRRFIVIFKHYERGEQKHKRNTKVASEIEEVSSSCYRDFLSFQMTSMMVKDTLS